MDLHSFSEIQSCLQDLILKVEQTIFHIDGLTEGDHVCISRYGGLYYHHGICIGHNNIIHCTRELELSDILCGIIEKEEAEIKIDTLEKFVGESSAIPRILKNVGKMKNDIIFLTGQQHKYDLIHNNCEHFANSINSNTSPKSCQIIRSHMCVMFTISALISSPHVFIFALVYTYAHLHTCNDCLVFFQSC